MSIQTVVRSKRKARKGKGFSRGELKEIGLSFNQALKRGIPVDTRRRTKHEENVKTLKKYLNET